MKLKYLPRIADEILEKKLKNFRAVYIAGPKWCGKTSTAERKAKSILYMQDPDSIKANMKIVDTKPSLLLNGEKPRLLDEWQVAPVLWDAVRFAIDKSDGKNGQYILTGSASVKEGSTMHTGTGRISRMIMRTMSLFESKESNGQISLRDLFAGIKDIEGISPLTIEGIAFALARGGWPLAVQMKGEQALAQVYDYIDATINIDINNVDGIKRDPTRVRTLMRSIARNISSEASINTLCKDLGQGEDMHVNTVTNYLNALEKLFVIEDLSAWNPSIRSATAVRRTPVRHFVDPSIATAVLRLNPEGLLKDFNTFGLLFESLCVRDLRVYCEKIDGQVFHYRDKSGLEADAVIQLKDGRWAAIEVKMGAEAAEEGAANLLRLRNKIDTEIMNEPSFLMVLTAGQYAYRNKDGVFIVPIGCLKD